MLARMASGRPVAIIADNDTPGRKGAEALASQLVLHCPSVKIIYPPPDIKDLRQWKAEGVTSERLVAAIEQSHRIKIGESTVTIKRKQRHGRREGNRA